jgi:hypothetical protein
MLLKGQLHLWSASLNITDSFSLKVCKLDVVSKISAFFNPLAAHYEIA